MAPEPTSAKDRALRAAQLPGSARQAWVGTPPSPAVHQVWRARWQNTAILVGILDADGSTITAAAITTTPDLADDHAVVVDPEHSHLGTTLVVWDTIARELPTRVLDRCLGTLAQTWRTAPRGRPITSFADRRHEERAAVQDCLDDLVAATWVRQFRRPLTELVEQGDNARLLLTLDGLTRADALSIRRGRRPLTDEQAAQMSIISPITTDEWLTAGPTLPDDLINAIDQPAERTQITSLARVRGIDEITARQEIAYDVYALAARQTGDDPTEDWSARLHHYLQAHEATP